MLDRFGYSPDYIYDQRALGIGDIPWGAAGNTADNGCGWIAVYNVLFSYNKKTTYRNVIMGLILYGAPNVGGVLGANPISIWSYLSRKFWFTSISLSGIGKHAMISDAMIVLLMWDSGVMHYTAGIATKRGLSSKKFKFYNSGLVDEDNKDIDGKAISLYELEEYIEMNKAIILCVISVNNKKWGW